MLGNCRVTFSSFCLLATVLTATGCAGNAGKPEVSPTLPQVTTPTPEIAANATSNQTIPLALTPSPSPPTPTSPPTPVTKKQLVYPKPIILQEKLIKVEAAPEKGFYWPYYLYIPGPLVVYPEEKRYLLVESNNTGYPTDDQEVHDSSAKKQATQNFGSSTLAREMKIPLLVPTFPRPPRLAPTFSSSPQNPPGIYTQALDRDTILTQEDKLIRIDIQLVAMIDDATERLSQTGIKVEKKVLMFGFSASGAFDNRFAILHPRRVQAAAIGSLGSWPIVPISEWNSVNLRYPIGVSDMKQLVGEEFDIESFKAVHLYFYAGDQDTNDSVPRYEAYDKEDMDLLWQYFGQTNIQRWPKAEEIYKSVGCSAQFVLYPGVGHTVTLQMVQDIKAFFLKNLAPR